MPSIPKNPSTLRIKATAYLDTATFEALSKESMLNGYSISGYLLHLITKHLQRQGHDLPTPAGSRRNRADFAPQITLAKALRAKVAAQEKDAERTRARIAKLESR